MNLPPKFTEDHPALGGFSTLYEAENFADYSRQWVTENHMRALFAKIYRLRFGVYGFYVLAFLIGAFIGEDPKQGFFYLAGLAVLCLLAGLSILWHFAGKNRYGTQPMADPMFHVTEHLGLTTGRFLQDMDYFEALKLQGLFREDHALHTVRGTVLGREMEVVQFGHAQCGFGDDPRMIPDPNIIAGHLISVRLKQTAQTRIILRHWVGTDEETFWSDHAAHFKPGYLGDMTFRRTFSMFTDDLAVLKATLSYQLVDALSALHTAARTDGLQIALIEDQLVIFMAMPSHDWRALKNVESLETSFTQRALNVMGGVFDLADTLDPTSAAEAPSAKVLNFSA